MLVSLIKTFRPIIVQVLRFEDSQLNVRVALKLKLHFGTRFFFYWTLHVVTNILLSS